MHGLPATNSYAATYAPCTQSTDAIRTRGDSWLARYVPHWTAAGADVLITFDEGGASRRCGSPGGGQIYGVLTGPGVSGGANATPMSRTRSWRGSRTPTASAARQRRDCETGILRGTPRLPIRSSRSPRRPVRDGLRDARRLWYRCGYCRIGQVQVSVDGGTPVTATGTTAWTPASTPRSCPTARIRSPPRPPTPAGIPARPASSGREQHHDCQSGRHDHLAGKYATVSGRSPSLVPLRILLGSASCRPAWTAHAGDGHRDHRLDTSTDTTSCPTARIRSPPPPTPAAIPAPPASP